MPHRPQPASSIFVFTVPGSMVFAQSRGGSPYRAWSSMATIAQHSLDSA